MNLRRSLEVPNFGLFKFDIDGVVDIFSTNVAKGDFVIGGHGSVQYKNKLLYGEFLSFGGKQIYV